MERSGTDIQCADKELAAEAVKCFCPQCGGEVVQTGRGRPRKFCSEKCLREWQNKNQCPPLRKTAVKRLCPVCGKEFLTDRLGSRPKKYCSRSCANRSRAADWKADTVSADAEVRNG